MLEAPRKKGATRTPIGCQSKAGPSTGEVVGNKNAPVGGRLENEGERRHQCWSTPFKAPEAPSIRSHLIEWDKQKSIQVQ